MEGLNRLVSESLARHGFDRPLDYRRLHWSRWFRCESHQSLLLVPSKPGVFAIAEEVGSLRRNEREEHDFSRAENAHSDRSALAAEVPGLPEAETQKPETGSPRMLAVTQFFEADDMAFILDRMLSRQNPMRARLISGRYFVRFVVIEDQAQRRSICSALNQWIVSSAEKASGIGTHFASSLELNDHTEYQHPQQRPVADSTASGIVEPERKVVAINAAQTRSDGACSVHEPAPFPSGF